MVREDRRRIKLFLGRYEKMGEGSSCFLKALVAPFLRKGVRGWMYNGRGTCRMI
jgi:CO dehydrogenase nickel-insertion accessory protein CooC1